MPYDGLHASMQKARGSPLAYQRRRQVAGRGCVEQLFSLPASARILGIALAILFRCAGGERGSAGALAGQAGQAGRRGDQVAAHMVGAKHRGIRVGTPASV